LTDKQDASEVYLLVYDPKKFSVVAEPKEVTDGRLKPVWGTSLVRLIFTARDKSATGQYQLMLRRKNQ